MCLLLFLCSDDKAPADGRIQTICGVCEAPRDWEVEGDQTERQIHVRQRWQSICKAIQGQRTSENSFSVWFTPSHQHVLKPMKFVSSINLFPWFCLFRLLSLFFRLWQEEDLHEMLRTSEVMENQYSHLFDKVIVNDDLSAAFSELRMMLRTVETETHWVPVSWTHSWWWKKDKNIQVHHWSVAGGQRQETRWGHMTEQRSKWPFSLAQGGLGPLLWSGYRSLGHHRTDRPEAKGSRWLRVWAVDIDLGHTARKRFSSG